METMKEVALPIVTVIIVLAVVIMVPIMIFDTTEFNRQMKCKEVGGMYVYESYNWICR